MNINEMLCLGVLYTVNSERTQSTFTFGAEYEGLVCNPSFPSLSITCSSLLSLLSSHPYLIPPLLLFLYPVSPSLPSSLPFGFEEIKQKTTKTNERLVTHSPHLALMLGYCHRGKGMYPPSPI